MLLDRVPQAVSESSPVALGCGAVPVPSGGLAFSICCAVSQLLTSVRQTAVLRRILDGSTSQLLTFDCNSPGLHRVLNSVGFQLLSYGCNMAVRSKVFYSTHCSTVDLCMRSSRSTQVFSTTTRGFLVGGGRRRYFCYEQQEQDCCVGVYAEIERTACGRTSGSNK